MLDLLAKQTTPPPIAEILGCAVTTVYNVKRRFLAEGLQSALSEKPRSHIYCELCLSRNKEKESDVEAVSNLHPTRFVFRLRNPTQD